MYNSYANRNAPGEQIPSGILQQVMRADRPQGQLSQPASAGYGFGSQGASYSGGLQQVMQADRQAPGAQQYRNTPQYGAIAPSYGTSYAGAGQQHGQAYGQGVNSSALSSVMQADRVTTGGASYTNYNAGVGNAYQAQSVNLQQAMQAARPTQMQAQYSSGSFYSSATPSGHAYGGSAQPQYQQQVAVQPVATQQIPIQQGFGQQVSAAPGLSQVMQADQTSYATGPSRSNYNY